MQKYYYTFSDSPGHPYRGGWIVIEAPSQKVASQVFRAYYPDKIDGILNCENVFTEHEFSLKRFVSSGIHNAFCHGAIGPHNDY